jgi:dolichol-phosphate mannosyltransferase
MLSLIIPTDCERENIGPLLKRVEAVRPLLGEPLEVLVVDNRSADGTAEAARRCLEYASRGRVIESARGGDLAHAVAEGIRESRGEVLGVMDADLSHPPELLPSLLRAVRGGASVAVASRYVTGGGIARWSAGRRVASRLANLLAHPLVPVADATSGYFVCRADLVRSLALQPQGFKILLEILVAGCVHDVREVPYVFTDRVRGRSKLGGRVAWRYAAQLARLYAHRRRHPCGHVRPAHAPSTAPERAHG